MLANVRVEDGLLRKHYAIRYQLIDATHTRVALEDQARVGQLRMLAAALEAAFEQGTLPTAKPVATWTVDAPTQARAEEMLVALRTALVREGFVMDFGGDDAGIDAADAGEPVEVENRDGALLRFTLKTSQTDEAAARLVKRLSGDAATTRPAE